LSDAEQFALGLFAIDHEATFEDMAATFDVGQQRRQQPARAAFRRRQHQLLLAGAIKHVMDELFNILWNGGRQGFDHFVLAFGKR